MGALAIKRADTTVVEETGVVVRVDEGGVMVRGSGPEYRARRAVSCLLAPEPGDRALIAIDASGEAYVLGVLERDSGAAATIAVEGDLDLRSERGEVRVTGAAGVSVVSPRTVSIVSEDLLVRSMAARVVVDGLTVLGKTVEAQIERAKVAAVSIDSVVDRWYQRAKRAYRVVEESDHLRAESVDIVGKKAVSVRSENASIVAEELVKVDGGQIQLG